MSVEMQPNKEEMHITATSFRSLTKYIKRTNKPKENSYFYAPEGTSVAY